MSERQGSRPDSKLPTTFPKVMTYTARSKKTGQDLLFCILSSCLKLFEVWGGSCFNFLASKLYLFYLRRHAIPQDCEANLLLGMAAFMKQDGSEPQVSSTNASAGRFSGTRFLHNRGNAITADVPKPYSEKQNFRSHGGEGPCLARGLWGGHHRLRQRTVGESPTAALGHARWHGLFAMGNMEAQIITNISLRSISAICYDSSVILGNMKNVGP